MPPLTPVFVLLVFFKVLWLSLQIRNMSDLLTIYFNHCEINRKKSVKRICCPFFVLFRPFDARFLPTRKTGVRVLASGPEVLKTALMNRRRNGFARIAWTPIFMDCPDTRM